MLNKAVSMSIKKHLETLKFVTFVDENSIEFYEIEDENGNVKEDDFEQIDFCSVQTDDRNAVMDNKKVELLQDLLREDDTVPEVVIRFERMDAYPNGTASYMVTVYEPF